VRVRTALELLPRVRRVPRRWLAPRASLAGHRPPERSAKQANTAQQPLAPRRARHVIQLLALGVMLGLRLLLAHSVLQANTVRGVPTQCVRRALRRRLAGRASLVQRRLPGRSALQAHTAQQPLAPRRAHTAIPMLALGVMLGLRLLLARSVLQANTVGGVATQCVRRALRQRLAGRASLVQCRLPGRRVMPEHTAQQSVQRRAQPALPLLDMGVMPGQ